MDNTAASGKPTYISVNTTVMRYQMRKRLYKKYPIKIWLATFFLTPFINVVWLFVFFGYTFNDIKDVCVLIVYMIAIGILLSLPSLLIFTFASFTINKYNFPNALKRLLLALLGIFLICSTFYFLDKEYVSNGGRESQIIIGDYIAVFVIAVLLLNPRPEKNIAINELEQQRIT